MPADFTLEDAQTIAYWRGVGHSLVPAIAFAVSSGTAYFLTDDIFLTTTVGVATSSTALLLQPLTLTGFARALNAELAEPRDANFLLIKQSALAGFRDGLRGTGYVAAVATAMTLLYNNLPPPTQEVTSSIMDHRGTLEHNGTTVLSP